MKTVLIVLITKKQQLVRTNNTTLRTDNVYMPRSESKFNYYIDYRLLNQPSWYQSSELKRPVLRSLDLCYTYK